MSLLRTISLVSGCTIGREWTCDSQVAGSSPGWAPLQDGPHDVQVKKDFTGDFGVIIV